MKMEKENIIPNIISENINHSLIRWEQNKNGVGLNTVNGDPIDFILLDSYLNLFTRIRNQIKESNKSKNKIVSFVDLWQKEMDIFTSDVEKVVLNYVKKHNITTLTNEQLKDIKFKAKGNVGEIMVIAIVIDGLVYPCLGGIKNVSVVNPQEESYGDIFAIHIETGYTIDIQVKNYDEKTLVDRDVFNKATTMRADRVDGENPRVPGINFKTKKLKEKYENTPHQIIFSFSKVSDERLLKENKKRVLYIGPKEIDAYKIQGDSEKNIPGRVTMFDKIIDNIKYMKQKFKVK